MKFIKGDNLRCVNSHGLVGVTNGKTYLCLSYDNCTDAVLIKNDNNVKIKYGSPNFVKQ